MRALFRLWWLSSLLHPSDAGDYYMIRVANLGGEMGSDKGRVEGLEGNFTIRLRRNWAPHWSSRFEELVNDDFFTDMKFYKVFSGYKAQFGIHHAEGKGRNWRFKPQHSPVKRRRNKKGRLSFVAMTGTYDSNHHDRNKFRGTEVFINLGDNLSLDKHQFVPFAKVVQGFEVCEKIYSGYGKNKRDEMPRAMRIEAEGETYLEDFPKLSWIRNVIAVPPPPGMPTRAPKTAQEKQEQDQQAEQEKKEDAPEGAHPEEEQQETSDWTDEILKGMTITAIAALTLPCGLGCVIFIFWLRARANPEKHGLFHFPNLSYHDNEPTTIGRSSSGGPLE